MLTSSDGRDPSETPPVSAQGDDDSIREGVTKAGPLALAGLFANGSSVIVTLLLARLLIPKDFGYFNQLVSLFLIVSTPGSAVIVAVVRRVSAWRLAHRDEELRAWVSLVHRRAAIGYGIYAVIVVLLSDPIATEVLSQHTRGRVIAMLLGAGLYVVLCIDRGILQATRSYGDLSINWVIEGAVRVVAVLGLTAISPHVLSACLGILLAECAAFAHARYRANKDLNRYDPTLVIDDSEDTATTSIVGDLVAAFIALALLALLQNADVILLGKTNQALSGAYAAISVPSKALYFAAIVLSGYLVPEAAIRWREGRHALRQLAVTFALLAVPAVLLLALALFMPNTLLKLVYGSRYLGAEHAFWILVVAMCALAVTVILSLYLLAVGKRWVVGLLAGGAVAAVIAINAAHGKPVAVATADCIVQGVLAVVVGLCFIFAHRRAHRLGVAR